MTIHRIPVAPRGAAGRAKAFFGLMIPRLGDIRDREPLLPPVVAAWIVSAGALLSLRPVFVGGASGGDAAAATMEVFFWALLALTPLIALVKAGLLAAGAWSVLAFGGVTARARQLLSVFLYGEAIMALRGVFAAVYTHVSLARGVARDALGSPVGLAGLVSPDQIALAAALQSVSLAHVAWATFIALALRETLDVSLRRSAVLAAGLWVAVAGASALRAVLTN